MALQFGPNILGAKLALSDAGIAGTLARTRTGVRGAKGDLQGLGREIKDTGRSFGATATKVLGFAAAITGMSVGVTEAVRKFMDFETGLAKIGTLLAPGSNAMAQYGNQVLDLSTKFGQSAADVAEGMFQAISAGVPAELGEKFMAIASKSAVGGFTDMRTAVDGLTNVINAYALSTSEAEHVSNVFFEANKVGKTTFEEMSRSIGNVAPLAAAVGVSFEELGASIAAVTKQGIGTAEVTTGLRQALSSVLKPSKEARDLAEELGLALGEQALKTKGLAGFARDLTRATGGSAEKMVTLLGSVEATGIMLAMTSKGGAKDFTDTLRTMTGAGGQMENAFGVAANRTEFKLNQLKATVEKLMIGVGEAIVEGFGGGPDGLTKGIDDAIPKIKAAVKDFMGFMRSSLETIGDLIKLYFVTKGLGFVKQFATGAADAIVMAAAKAANGGAAPRNAAGQFMSSEELAAGATGKAGMAVKAAQIMGNVTLFAQTAFISWEVGKFLGENFFGPAFNAVTGGSEAIVNAASERQRQDAILGGKDLGGKDVGVDRIVRMVAAAAVAGNNRPSMLSSRADFANPKALGYSSNAAIEGTRGALVDKLMGEARGLVGAFSPLTGGAFSQREQTAIVEQVLAQAVSSGLVDWLPALQAQGEKQATETAAKLAAEVSAVTDPIVEALGFVRDAQATFANQLPGMLANGLKFVIDLNHKIKDNNNNRSHQLRASRGDGTARHLNPRYRAFVLRTGEGAGTVEPMPENYHGGHVLNGGT